MKNPFFLLRQHPLPGHPPRRGGPLGRLGHEEDPEHDGPLRPRHHRGVERTRRLERGQVGQGPLPRRQGRQAPRADPDRAFAGEYDPDRVFAGMR